VVGESKICSKCKILKKLSEFPINSIRRNIYCSWCKDCRKTHEQKRIKRRLLKNDPDPTVKICSKCKIEKTINNFSRDFHSSDGIYTICKDCKKEYLKNRIEFLKKEGYEIKSHKICNVCGKEKLIKDFSIKDTSFDGHFHTCKQCNKNKTEIYKHKFLQLRHSSTKRNIVFEFTEDSFKEWYFDREEVCYYCKKPIDVILKFNDDLKNSKSTNPLILGYKKFLNQVSMKTTEMTIDRKDSTISYCEQNCVKACCWCNELKGWRIKAEHMIFASEYLDEAIEELKKENIQ